MTRGVRPPRMPCGLLADWLLSALRCPATSDAVVIPDITSGDLLPSCPSRKRSRRPATCLNTAYRYAPSVGVPRNECGPSTGGASRGPIAFRVLAGRLSHRIEQSGLHRCPAEPHPDRPRMKDARCEILRCCQHHGTCQDQWHQRERPRNSRPPYVANEGPAPVDNPVSAIGPGSDDAMATTGNLRGASSGPSAR